MSKESENKKACLKNEPYKATLERIQPQNKTQHKTSNSKPDSEQTKPPCSWIETKKKAVMDKVSAVKDGVSAGVSAVKDGIMHLFAKEDATRVQITQAEVIKITGEPVPDKCKNEHEILAEEIGKNHQIFSALLPMSAAVLEPVGTESIPLSADSLLSKWKYSLSLGSCETLLQKFNSFISGDTEQVATSLKQWMDFLKECGIKQLDSNAGRIIISTQNRANYQNGYEFKDGVECLVEQHPWIYRDILICPGMLMQAQEAETGGSGSEVSSI